MARYARVRADVRLGDQNDQCMDAHAIFCCNTSLPPGQSDLHGVLEAELARDLIGEQRGLWHQQAGHVVGQQVDPQL